METITFFNMETLPLYLLGFIAFLGSILDHWLNPNKTFKPLAWYVQEFIYTIISIALGISVCFAMETSISVCWIVSIVGGLIGSTLIRRIRNDKDSIVDGIIISVKNKTKSKLEK